ARTNKNAAPPRPARPPPPPHSRRGPRPATTVSTEAEGSTGVKLKSAQCLIRRVLECFVIRKYLMSLWRRVLLPSRFRAAAICRRSHHDLSVSFCFPTEAE